MEIYEAVCRVGLGSCELVHLMFGDMLWSEIYCFLDDCNIPSATVEQGCDRLKRAFGCIRVAGLKLKPSKCKLFQTTAKILGVVVSDGRIQEDPTRADLVRSWPFPQTVKDLRRFLGFANFGRNFYANFAEITAPLTACLRKGSKLECNKQTLRAFERVKEIMTSPPVLALFDSSAKRVILEWYASSIAVGACLKQVDESGAEVIVAYASKTLSPAQTRYCTTRRELLAIIFALTRWRHYLIGRPVVVRTDHNCLQFLLKGKSLTNQLARYLDFIADYDLKIEWTPGNINCIADALSRLPCGDACKQCRVPVRRTCSGHKGQHSAFLAAVPSPTVTVRGQTQQTGTLLGDVRKTGLMIVYRMTGQHLGARGQATPP